MSNSVDQRIVEMQFDNASFEKGIADTMTSLNKLDKSLNLEGGVKSLQQVESSVNNIDFSKMSSSLDAVNNKMSALGVATATVISNLTTMATSTAMDAVRGATIQPMLDGMNEYELKLNSIKTIQANTGRGDEKGLQEITAVLNELNEYADQTIYNFAEMTRNIGTFTAAGVGLEESATAIKGIANLAAMSGSNSQQASVAMYQLSQALASGTVKLQDWNSVVNAGMGGRVFQEALKETSRVLHTGVDEAIAAEGSFRDSLKSGWLTSEVLTKTLRNFTLASEELEENNRLMLEQEGYSKEQIDNIIQTAKLAQSAATEVKTFAQLIDTTKEALGSGWAETWEYIMGDILQAQRLWTWIANGLGDVIGSFDKVRNDFFRAWNSGQVKVFDRASSAWIFQDVEGVTSGWEAMFEALQNIVEVIGYVVDPIKQVFEEVFHLAAGAENAGIEAAKATMAFRDFTKSLKDNFRESAAGKLIISTLTVTFKVLFEAIKLGGSIIAAAFNVITTVIGAGLTFILNSLDGILGAVESAVNWFASIMSEFDISGFFDNIASFFSGLHLEFIAQVFHSLGQYLDQFFDALARGDSIPDTIIGFITNISKIGDVTIPYLGEDLKNVAEGIKSIADAAAPVVLDALSTALNVLRSVWENVWPVIQSIGTKIVDIWTAIVEAVQNSGFSFEPFIDMLSGFGKALSEFVAKVSEEGFSVDKVFELFDNLRKNFDEYVPVIREMVSTLFESVGSAVYENLDGPLKDLLDWASSISDPLSAIADALGAVSDTMSGLFGSLKLPWDNPGVKEGADAFSDAVDTGYEAVSMFDRIVQFIKNPVKSISGFVSKTLNGFAQGVNEFINSLKTDEMAEFLSTFAGMGVLGGVAVGLSKLVQLMDAFTTLAKGASKFMGSLATIGENIGNLVKTLQTSLKAATVMSIAVSVGILVAALFALTLIVQSDNIDEALGTLLILIGTVVSVFLLLGKVKVNEGQIEAFSNAMLKLGALLGIMASVTKILGSMDPSELIQGAAAITVFTLVIRALMKAASLSQGLAAIGKGMLELSVAIAIIVGIAYLLSRANLEEMAPGFVAVALIIAALGGVSIALSKLSGDKVVGSQMALLTMAAALAIVGVVIALLANVIAKDVNAAIVAAVMMGLLLAELAGIALILSNFAGGTEFTGAAASIVAMCAGLVLIAGAIALLTATITMSGDLKSVVIAWVGIAGMLLVMAVAVDTMAAAGPNARLSAEALGVLCTAVALMAAAIAALTLIDTTTLAVTTLLFVASFALIAGMASVFFLAAQKFVVGVDALAGLTIAIGVAALGIGASAMLIAMALEKLAVVGPAAVDAFIESIKKLGPGLWDAKEEIAMGIAGIGAGLIAGFFLLIPAAVQCIAELLSQMGAAFIANAEPLAYGATTSVIVIIASIANALHDNVDAINEAIMLLGLVIVEGLVNLLIKGAEALGGFIDGIAESIGIQTPGIADHIRDFGQTVKDGFAEAMDGMDTQALDEVMKTAQAVTSGQGIMGEAGAQLGATTKDSALGGLSGIEETVNKVLGGLPILGKEAGAETNESVESELNKPVDTSNFMSNLQGIPDEAGNIGIESIDQLMSGMRTRASESDLSGMFDFSKLSGDGGSASEAGQESANSYVDSFNGTVSQADLSSSTGSITEQLSANGEALKTTGYENGTQYTEGLSSGLDDASRVSREKGQEVVSSFESGASGGFDAAFAVGEQVSAGVAAGLESHLDEVRNAAAAVISAANETMNAVGQIASPSRLTARVGRFLALGVARGLSSQERSVGESAAEFTTSVIDAMNINSLLDSLLGDISDNPTITPVLDLDEYARGVNAMNAMTPSGRQITGVAALPTAGQYALAGRIMGYSDVSSVYAGTRHVSGSDRTAQSPTGNQYIINGLEYLPGSAIADSMERVFSEAMRKTRM